VDIIKNNKPIFLGYMYAIIFGFTFLFTKTTLEHVYDGYHLLAFRFLIAFLVMTILIILKIIKINLIGKKVRYLIILGIFQPIIYFIFETKGLQLLPTSQAGIMVACLPIIVTILASIFLDEKIKIKHILFIGLSILGAVTINSSNLQLGNLEGTIYLLIAMFSAAIFNILSRKLSTKFTIYEITYLMIGFGAIIFNIISITIHVQQGILVNYFNPLMNIKSLIGLLYLGILASVIAFILLNYVLAKIEASKASVFANFVTVVAVLAGVIILKERFTWIQVVGSIMILIGVYGTQKA
jgi:drug/metabolite transporter (DMT)-like permease